MKMNSADFMTDICLGRPSTSLAEKTGVLASWTKGFALVTGFISGAKQAN